MSSVAFVNNFTFNFNNSCTSSVRALDALTTPNNSVAPVVESSSPADISMNASSSVHTNLHSSHSWPSWPPTITTNTLDTEKIDDSFDVLNYASMSTPKKVELVRDLIDVTADILGNIWGKPDTGSKVLPLNIFVQETIKRSQSSYCTLLTALLYIFRIKDQILTIRKSSASKDGSINRKPKVGGEQVSEPFIDRILCARRMFLAALILASKFLQDRNYTNGAWAKTLGSNVLDININENAFLRLIDYRLFVSLPMFASWSNMCMKFIQSSKEKRCGPVKQVGESLHPHKTKTHTRSGPYPISNATNDPSSKSQQFVALLRFKAQKHREMLQSLQSTTPSLLKQQPNKHIRQLPSPSASP
ncbi:PHO85 cyclin-5 [Basidiobolus ranarum]|uniref:PHO85 cyclin-5 n=1 Tax=Basidiobolus ranarum TaxID=34480 RepID=A0ABR2WNC1_9FUNG